MGRMFFGVASIGVICSMDATVLAQSAGEQILRSAPGIVLKIQTSTTVGFSPCDDGTVDGTDKPGNVGVVRIRLPEKIVIGEPLIRAVKFKPKSFDPDSQEDADDTVDEKDDSPNPRNPATSAKPQPFHIYLGQGQLPANGFAIVRVIIPKAAKYHFYRGPSSFGFRYIEGVGAGDVSGDPTICGHRQIKGNPKNSPQVATFYVDLSRLGPGQSRPFNIAIEPDNAEGTPIFIDPKVHNDG